VGKKTGIKFPAQGSKARGDIQMQQTTTTTTKQQDDDARAAARQRIMLGAVVAGVSLAMLFFFFKGRDSPTMAAIRELAGGERPQAEAADGDADGGASDAPTRAATGEDERKAPGGTPEQLLEVARAAKAAGFVMMGVTQCVWTRRQRELFGGAGSAARKEIESIYVECRSRTDCPNVRGYPTWARGDRQFPGYRDLDAVRVMIKDAGSEPKMPMLQAPPEPIDEALPEERPALQAPAPPTQPPSSASPSASAPPAASSAAARSELAALIRSISSEVVDELLKTRAPPPGAPGGAPPPGQPMIEKARGVSNYPPLNVPDMPGTAPWNVGPSLFVDQAVQGNVPRQSEELNDATVSLARQMASTFQQIAFDNRQNPASADFATARLPHAAQIGSTENPLTDKRVLVV
jgi:hypothetical protein